MLGSEGCRKSELIDLYKMNLEYCIGCGACYATGKCFLFDDFVEIFEKIMGR